MKKTVKLGMIIMAVLMLCTGCGSKDEKLSDRKFEKIVQAYWDYFTYEFDESIARDDAWAKIVVDEDGSPMMMVQEYDEVNKLIQNMLYGYEKGKVSLIYHFPANTLDAIYTDGIVAVISFREVDGWQEEDMIELYKLDKEMERIGAIDLESREIEISYKHKKLSWQDEGDEQEYQEFVDDLYKLIYGRTVKPRALEYKCDLFELCNFFRSAPMAYGDDYGLLPKQDFQRQVNALIKEGGMTQEEFLLWDLEFYIDKMGHYMDYYDDDLLEAAGVRLSSSAHTFNLLLSILERDASLLNDLDEDIWENQKEGWQKVLLSTIVQTKDYTDWLKKVDLLKELTKDELVDYFVQNLRAQSEEWLYSMGGDCSNKVKNEIMDQMEEKARKVLSKKSGEKMFEAYYSLEMYLPEELEEWLDEY